MISRFSSMAFSSSDESARLLPRRAGARVSSGLLPRAQLRGQTKAWPQAHHLPAPRRRRLANPSEELAMLQPEFCTPRDALPAGGARDHLGTHMRIPACPNRKGCRQVSRPTRPDPPAGVCNSLGTHPPDLRNSPACRSRRQSYRRGRAGVSGCPDVSDRRQDSGPRRGRP
jgi:hypothetical protein